ncbi:glycosyltransferase family 4 protein [Flavobacterium sp.]|jgi:glycosyltransferase involved in cell wall biosynthesis|uniref:glycosyltransferase family 4 protein n=1 Tax=Flavobacterium sp. TaxID=239 RepID=UPI0037C0B761
MKSKNILIFHPYLAPYRIDLFNSLAQSFHLFVVLTGGDKEINAQAFDIEQVNKNAKFEFKYVNRGFYFGRHLISFTYLRYFFKLRPSIVFAHELGFNTVISIFFKKIFNYKLFVTIDDSLPMSQNYTWCRSWLRSFVYRFVDEIIVVNPQVKEFLVQKFKKNKAKFFYFPIVQDEQILLSKIKGTDTDSLIEKYNLNNKKVILFVGRFEPVKSPMLLVEVFGKISKKYSDVKLIMVGDGSLQPSLNRYVKDHFLEDVVKMPGKLTGTDLYTYFHLANIFILPSVFEPFGAVVNEALVAGCYCIVSEVSGSSVLINSENGLLFESENPNDLYIKIEQAIMTTNSTKVVASKMENSFQWYFDKLSDRLYNYV